MKTDIGIIEKNLESNIKNLTVVLSNAMILYVKTRKFHWNVTGASFMELHVLFENQYNALEKSIDEIAERISKLGGKPIGTMEAFLRHSTLNESDSNPDSKTMITELLKDHEDISKELRVMISSIEENTDDIGTADFLTALLQQHETEAWKLRKYTK
jgi:starvation-inducible DNA-binding protein